LSADLIGKGSRVQINCVQISRQLLDSDLVGLIKHVGIATIAEISTRGVNQREPPALLLIVVVIEM
jgi:hypothetical protein